MKILDTQTGAIHEYGTDGHDSLYVSRDGRYLTYYNLQNGDGSGVGDYRFVCDDNKVPEQSETAEAIHADVYFNIGGWHKSTRAEKLYTQEDLNSSITKAITDMSKVLTEKEELIKQMKLFKGAYLLTINELLPDLNCDNCKYKNKKYCDDRDCHKAIHRYFLNKAKE